MAQKQQREREGEGQPHRSWEGPQAVMRHRARAARGLRVVHREGEQQGLRGVQGQPEHRGLLAGAPSRTWMLWPWLARMLHLPSPSCFSPNRCLRSAAAACRTKGEGDGGASGSSRGPPDAGRETSSMQDRGGAPSMEDTGGDLGRRGAPAHLVAHPGG